MVAEKIKILILFGGARPNSIGAAIARAFVDTDKWAVHLFDKPEVVKAESWVNDYPAIVMHKCDLLRVTDIFDAIQLVESYANDDHELAGMIYAAGFNRINAVVDYQLDDFEKTMHLNVTAPFLCMQAVVRRFTKTTPSGKPFIYTILGSQTAYIAKTRTAPYGASKAAVNHLAACMHRELAPAGYRVNVLNFGPVLDTDMDVITQDELKRQRGWGKDEYLHELTKNIPIKRFTKPEEIATLALFLQEHPEVGELFGGRGLNFDGGQLQG